MLCYLREMRIKCGKKNVHTYSQIIEKTQKIGPKSEPITRYTIQMNRLLKAT